MMDFLAALSDTGRAVLPARRVAMIVAHPDDETIGCGAQLFRLDGATMVLVTDGAPRNLRDAQRLGFEDAETYAEARHVELLAALDIGGARLRQLARLGIPDQEAAPNLALIARRIERIVQDADIDTIITHAYEGGHPDHDSVAFCVHAAAALKARNTGSSILIVEMPLYSLGGASSPIYQQFLGDTRVQATTLHLSGAEQSLKRRMIAAYRTQARVLLPFSVEIERFRPAPMHDFRQLPNEGRLLYEHHGWGLDGKGWLGHAERATNELRIGGHLC
jgi:N-acetylglucosamine malate deacetylase 2